MAIGILEVLVRYQMSVIFDNSQPVIYSTRFLYEFDNCIMPFASSVWITRANPDSARVVNRSGARENLNQISPVQAPVDLELPVFKWLYILECSALQRSHPFGLKQRLTSEIRLARR